MLRRNELYLASLLPIVVGAFGLYVVAGTLRFRAYWSPLPGVLVGVVLLVNAALAVWHVWRGTARAPVVIGVAGGCALGAMLGLDWLFPIVNATSEPPSVMERLWYPLALVLLTALTTATVYHVRRLVARAP